MLIIIILMQLTSPNSLICLLKVTLNNIKPNMRTKCIIQNLVTHTHTHTHMQTKTHTYTNKHSNKHKHMDIRIYTPA